jgi:histidyl-tRNA synthetase
MESDFSLQEDKIHGQKQIPTIDRLRNVQKRIESVDKVLDDVKKLQIKGQVLQTMSKTEKANNDEQTLETKAEHSDSIEDSKAHTKLDVEELVEIDRGLQYVKWLQVVQDISNKVRNTKCGQLYYKSRVPFSFVFRNCILLIQ